MANKFIVGVSLTSKGVQAILTDDSFEVIESASKDFSGNLGKESIAVKVQKTITSLPNFHMAKAVGISLPVVFGSDGKTVVSSSIETLIGANAYQVFAKKIDIPIFLQRRNIALMLAERAFGALKTAKDAVLVEIGRDISSCLLINGKIYKGYFNQAGQIENTIVDITREKRNSAGSFGSLVSGEGITALTGKSVYEILRNNPKSELVSKQIIRDLKESLLTGLLNVKLILDPQLMVISGEILENFKLFESSFSDFGIDVVKSELGEFAACQGSAIATYNQLRRGK